RHSRLTGWQVQDRRLRGQPLRYPCDLHGTRRQRPASDRLWLIIGHRPRAPEPRSVDGSCGKGEGNGVMRQHIGLAIDPATNDLFLRPNGELAIVRGAEAVGQHVRQRLKTFSGEWFLDTAAGVPWLDEILGRGYDPALAEAVVKGEVLDTDGVT